MSDALKRAWKRYRAGKKVFDEEYLKAHEEWINEELRSLGLSKKDVEELIAIKPKLPSTIGVGWDQHTRTEKDDEEFKRMLMKRRKK